MRPTEQSASQASNPDLARSEADNLLGDFRGLLCQVGSPGVALDSDGAFWTASVQAPCSLREFLENYLTHLLQPCELPAIVAACGNAQRGELRELMALDHRLAEALLSTPFAAASRRMGGLQLARLRPLRDCRIVKRYLAATEAGHAHGWHTLVYGVTLAVFSLPLRQGLLYYSHQTLSVLAAAAARAKSIGQSELDEMLSALSARLPGAVETALAVETLPKA